MAWFAIYQTADGRLVSIGEADAMPVIVGMVALELIGKPDLKLLMWDESQRIFINRPAKVVIDRLDDVQSHPNFAEFMEAFLLLNATNRQKIRNGVIRLIGRHRYRVANESVEL